MVKKILLLLIFLLSSISGWAELDYIVMVDTSSSMAPFIDDLSKYLKLELVLNNLNQGDTFHLIRFADYPTFELRESLSGQKSIDRILKEVGFLKAKLLFGKYTDIISAIEYLIDYAESLNGLDEKVLILLSDGIHDPPPDSPYANMSPEDVQQIIEHFANTIIDKNGWRIHLNRIPTADYFNFDQYKENQDNQKSTESGQDKRIPEKDSTELKNNESPDSIKNQDPFTGSPSPFNQETDLYQTPDIPDNSDNQNSDIQNNEDTEHKVYDIFDPLSDALEQDVYEYPTEDPDLSGDLLNRLNGFPKLEFPDDLGTRGRHFSIPFYVTNFGNDQIILELSSISFNDTELLKAPLKPKRFPPNQRVLFSVPLTLPQEFPKGEHELNITLDFTDNNRIYPRQGILKFEYIGNTSIITPISQFFSDYGFIVLMVLSIMAIALVIFLLIRSHLLSNLFTDFLKPPEWRDRLPVGEKKGDQLIEMRVDFQNHKIGFRNIHNLPEGKICTVGGGLSHFLVFLVPMESHIAEISNQEGRYIFTPVKTEYFPQVKTPIKNCLNKDIPVISSKGFAMTIRFSEYVSPLLQLNNILHQADRTINPEID